MKVVVEITEEAQAAMPPSAALSRDLLEAYVVEQYRRGTMTQKQVGIALALDRWSTEELLRRYDALKALTLADYELERASRGAER